MRPSNQTFLLCFYHHHIRHHFTSFPSLLPLLYPLLLPSRLSPFTPLQSLLPNSQSRRPASRRPLRATLVHIGPRSTLKPARTNLCDLGSLLPRTFLSKNFLLLNPTPTTTTTENEPHRNYDTLRYFAQLDSVQYYNHSSAFFPLSNLLLYERDYIRLSLASLNPHSHCLDFELDAVDSLLAKESSVRD